MRRRAGIAAIVAAAVLAAIVGFATPAFAHNVLVASTPEPGETLTALPEAFSVTTNEPLLALPGSQGFALQVRDAAGFYYGDGCVTIVDATMSATASLGEAGEYTMLWQAVSADGHSIDGEIPFSWRPPEAADAPRSAEPPVCGEAAGDPSESASPAAPAPEPSAEPETASGVDVATVLWIGGALLALGIAVAVAIVLAGRRRTL